MANQIATVAVIANREIAMAGRPTKAQKIEIDARRIRVQELYLRGIQQWQIAQKEGVDPATITRDLAAIRHEWQEQRVAYCDEAIAKELAKLDRLELEYWNAWRRSCEAAEKNTTKKVTDENGDRLEASVTKEYSSGDPRFLDGVFKVIDRRLRLFGKDAPVKVAPVNPDGTKWTPEAVQKLSDDDVRQIDGIYERCFKTPASGFTEGGSHAAELN